MVRNLNIALQALHEVLVAARNIGMEDPETPALLAIVDSVEMLPIWMAAPDIDRTAEIIRVLEGLAAEYPECGIAAQTGRKLNDVEPRLAR